MWPHFEISSIAPSDCFIFSFEEDFFMHHINIQFMLAVLYRRYNLRDIIFRFRNFSHAYCIYNVIDRCVSIGAFDWLKFPLNKTCTITMFAVIEWFRGLHICLNSIKNLTGYDFIHSTRPHCLMMIYYHFTLMPYLVFSEHTFQP